LLDLAIWKIGHLLEQPFRYRTQCHLSCESVSLTAGEQKAATIPKVDIKRSIARCEFKSGVISVYYPASKLFKVGEADTTEAKAPEESDSEADQS
jgi:hypothetical protein